MEFIIKNAPYSSIDDTPESIEQEQKVGRFSLSKRLDAINHPRSITCPYCDQPYDVEEDMGVGITWYECEKCNRKFDINWFTEIHYFTNRIE